MNPLYYVYINMGNYVLKRVFKKYKKAEAYSAKMKSLGLVVVFC